MAHKLARIVYHLVTTVRLASDTGQIVDPGTLVRHRNSNRGAASRSPAKRQHARIQISTLPRGLRGEVSWERKTRCCSRQALLSEKQCQSNGISGVITLNRYVAASHRATMEIQAEG